MYFQNFFSELEQLDSYIPSIYFYGIYHFI